MYFYDQGKQDLIAEGVKVNGVPIGGMTRAKPRRSCPRRCSPRSIARSRSATSERTFTLTQKAARVGINISGSVDKALKHSQEGDMFSRSWRNLRNESLNTELAAEVSWNKPAIDKLVKRVQRSIDRQPKDAAVDLSKGQVKPTKSQTGLRVKYNSLAKEVEQTLLDPGNTETVKVQTNVVQPKVSTKQLASKYPAIMIVDRRATS